MQSAKLVLQNGLEFTGELIGAPLISSGELVFNTGMVGYNEALTDPSYFGQILIFSYPLIGNYGIPEISEDYKATMPTGYESLKIHTAAVIISRESAEAYHWSASTTVDTWLKKQKVAGIVGIDTRELIYHVRDSGKTLGIIKPEKPEGVRVLDPKLPPIKEDVFFDPSEFQIIKYVSREDRIIVGKGSKRVALVDCGTKLNIVRNMVRLGCEVEIVPWNTNFNDVDCNAWVLSNGPGDPQNTGDLPQRVAGLLKGKRPVLGICLGNQLLGIACGGTTERLTHGHRGHNQPVYEFGSRRCFMTSQNHGYVVSQNSLPDDWQPWFINANDRSIEGIIHSSGLYRGVQFHPEAAGGPCDTQWIFDDFVCQF